MRNLFAMAMILALVAGPASSDTILLTFDDVACHDDSLGGPTNSVCTVSGQPIGSDYGSLTGLTVFFKPGDRPGITPDENHKASNFGTPGDFSAGQLANSPPNPDAEIVFTPAPGYEVSLVSFARLRGTNTNNNANYRLSDPDGLPVYLLNVPSNPLGKVTEAVNSAFYTGPITFGYNSTQGATRVDDIRLELRQVPEPSTCAMLFGLAAMFRRRPIRG